jgi:hypothetical protein
VSKTKQAPLPTLIDEHLERSFLGAILLGTGLWCPCSQDDFTLTFHKTIWRAIEEIRVTGGTPALDSVVAHLSARGPVTAEDRAYIASLLDGAIAESTSTLNIMADTLRDLRVRRELVAAADGDIKKASDRSESIIQLLERRRAADELLCERLRQPRHDGDVVDGRELLNDLVRFIKRFLYLSDSQATVIALWVVHTHAFDAAVHTPYLAISSAEKQSGKTRLLELLKLVVARPWLTGRTSAAALVRKVSKDQVTVLLDESDAAFKGSEEYTEVLRGILNSGYTRGGCASLVVGKGTQMEVKDFLTFCPKAIAGIGKLPDTIADRSIPILLKRKPPGAHVERFRHRLVAPDGKALAERAAAWASHSTDALKVAFPELPDALSDRRQDVIEPLLAIADLVGDEWPARARAAVVEVFEGPGAEDQSIRVRLLADIRTIFQERHTQKISSEALVEALSEIETSPWAELNHGKNISKNGLARHLKAFQLFSKTIRFGETLAKGYELEQFTEAFSTYLAPVSPETKRNNVTSQYPRGSETLFANVTETPCYALKNTVSVSIHAACDDVTPQKQEHESTPEEGPEEVL